MARREKPLGDADMRDESLSVVEETRAVAQRFQLVLDRIEAAIKVEGGGDE
jgi:hypothetical protein